MAISMVCGTGQGEGGGGGRGARSDGVGCQGRKRGVAYLRIKT